MKYYLLEDDMFDDTRWYLSKLLNTEPWRFTGSPMVPMDDPLRSFGFEVEIEVDGKTFDYTTTDYGSVPIASFKVLQAISGLDGFTAFPVKLSNHPQSTSYHILHFWDVIDCFDEERASFEIIPPGDPEGPDRVGDYRSITRFMIDPKRAECKHIFRVARATTYVVVSEEVKKRFEAKKVVGAVFECVSED